MSDYWRHWIGVLSASILGLIAAGLAVAFVGILLASAFSDDVEPEQRFMARAFLVCGTLVGLAAGAKWGLA